MITEKERATQRVRSRYFEFARKREIAEKEAEKTNRENQHYKQMIATEGWKLLYPSLERKIQEMQSELSETSSFRLLKCMELRSQIKALKTLYIQMSRAEKLGLLATVRD